MYKRFLNWYISRRIKELEMNLNTSSSDNLNDLNDKGEKKSNSSHLNQPSKKSKEPFNWKKFAVWSVFGLIVIGIITAIGFSFAGNGPRQFRVKNVVADNNSYTLIGYNDEKRTIDPSRTLPFFYWTTSSSFNVVYGDSFNGFYYTAYITDAPILVSSESTPNNTVSVSGPFVIIGNYRVAIDTGRVYVQQKDPQGNSYPNQQWKEDNLANSLTATFQNVTSNITVQPQSTNFLPIILNVLSLIIPIIFIVILLRSYKSMQGGGAGGPDGIFGIGKSQAKIAESNVMFTDVAGIEEEKSELIEIVDYLKRPERYAAMGARVPKGVILYGPPGTGKTLLAKAVAGEAKVPFFQVSGSAFEDMLVGVGAKRVRDLFQKAIKAAPSIIFIDEIDSVGSKRGKFETTAGSLADQTLNQLLAEMDGFNNRTGVIVMAATNRLDVLDDALLRPGRFDRHIQVNLPDIKERTAILKIHARNKNLSKSVDLEDVSRRTPGFSGAQLENVLNEATLLAVRKNKTSINIDDLDEAIDRVIAGPAKKTRVISPEEKTQIAYHEAGHALVGLHTKGSDVVQKITIIPRGQAAGYTLSVPETKELSIQKKSDLLGMIAGALGGRAAEEMIYGKESVSTGAANDLYKVTNIVRSMVMQLGMSDLGMTQFVPSEGVTNPYQQKLYSETTALSIDKEIDKIIKQQYQYACKVITENKKELDLIVESLLVLETIVKPQIDYIHKHKKLPKEVLEKKAEQEAKKDLIESEANQDNQYDSSIEEEVIDEQEVYLLDSDQEIEYQTDEEIIDEVQEIEYSEEEVVEYQEEPVVEEVVEEPKQETIKKQPSKNNKTKSNNNSYKINSKKNNESINKKNLSKSNNKNKTKK